MSNRLKLSSSLLVTALLAASFAGCTPQAQQLGQNGGNMKGPHITHEDVTNFPNRESQGIAVRNDLASAVNKMNGFRNATVLTYNGNAYVGFTRIGPEKGQDAAIQSGDNWQDMPHGTQSAPKSATGMSVQELAKEGLPDAAVHDGPYSTAIGNFSAEDKQKVADIVRKGAPGVKNVYITGDIDQVQELSGYRAFIARGGDMRPHMNRFLTFISSKVSKQ